MNLPEKAITQEIITLHNEIGGYLKMSLQKAIRIGEILTEQKESLKHGEWLSWIKDNMPFTYRTADRYLELFNGQDILKLDTVSNLNDAYKAMNESRNLKRIKKREEDEKRIEYCETHQKEIEEKTPVETVEKGTLPCGWACERVITGYSNGLPYISTKCIDPEYLKLEPNEATKELQSLIRFEVTNELNSMKYGLNRIQTGLKKMTKNYNKDEIVNAYKLDWNEGVIYLYPEIKKKYSEIKKLIEKLDSFMEGYFKIEKLEKKIAKVEFKAGQ